MDFNKSITAIASEMKNASVEELKTSYIAGSSSHKIEVSNAFMGGKYISTILYLLQGNLSGAEVCANRTESCSAVCLGTNSGHAAMVKHGEKTNMVQVARLKKTILFRKYRKVFMARLEKELTALVAKAHKKGVTPCFRFNGTSDLPVENLGLLEKFPQIMFYDYTKSLTRMEKFLAGKMPSNYHLTFSYTPETEEEALSVLNLGGNVAVGFDEKSKKGKLPSFVGKRFLGFPVINGDEHDLRFADPQGGFIVGLTKKGRAKGEFFISPLKCKE